MLRDNFSSNLRCGKTTQVPQFILDASLQAPGDAVHNIICTQPRRISAMAVAQRVADERVEKCGNTVGYQIRLESCMVKHIMSSICCMEYANISSFMKV